jgi:hypothetical protein
MSGGSALRRVRATSGRTSSTWWLKKALLSALVIGGLGSFTVASTFAVLSSQSANPTSSLSSGTLTFGNKVGTGSTCNSYGAGSTANVNPSCSAVFTATTQVYPGVPSTTNVQIVDNGSLDITDLSLFMESCTAGATSGAPANTGDPCGTGGLMLYLQETNSGGTDTTCWYPTQGPGSCAFAADTLSNFVGNFFMLPLALSLGAGPVHGATRYFRIGVELPIGASNTLQGRSATFGLTWHITN